ncbi:MAG: helicase-related protein [Raoultibacter sp.]
MKKQQIKQWVESALSNASVEPLTASADSAYAQFLLNCARRLVTAFKLYQQDRKYLGDCLIALRNYLLTFQSEIFAPSITASEVFDRYGLWADSETGAIKAAYQFPAYLDSDFTQMAFLSEDYSALNQTDDSRYNLQTDPMIDHTTGFSHFKSLAQKIALYGALNTPDGYTTLISMPTGGGKSLITQAVSYQKEGLTIVIVPTISLAIDQVRVARNTIKVGNPEEEIFYYSSGVDAAPILDAIRKKKARMLFISPEALILNKAFANEIKLANDSRSLKNIIIDEAHIVVDWGADFRIDYQCLESWRKKLMLHNPQIRTILLSATFECRCRDILKDFFSKEEKWIEIRCDALRHEPRYMLIRCKSNHEKSNRIVELVRKCPHPMIVYVARPDDAERIRTLLQSNGIMNVNTFTGLTTTAKRRELINSWINDEFDVMVATSAFGVGVDKADIRTVLHAYVPQNPNAYYQELGRSGRDQLPCLSIMCMIEDDITVAFQRISKKVMTTEKIIGRWDSLYNNALSMRYNSFVTIDTTIKPSYSVEDLFDDSPASEADIRWNAYVLLLLRRYKKIRIEEVVTQNVGYSFVIKVLDDVLRNNDGHLQAEIEAIRTKEWDYYTASFELMKKSIRKNGKECWSEMFFETYDQVFEYCAGCASHKKANIGDSAKFTLKAPVEAPRKEFSANQLSMFGEANHLIIRTKPEKLSETLKELSRRQISSLVVPPDWDGAALLPDATARYSLLILDSNELGELIKNKSWFYVSGLIAILYQGSARDIYKQLVTVTNELQPFPWVRMIHIIYENTYFDWITKSFTDILDGCCIQSDALRSI